MASTGLAGRGDATYAVGVGIAVGLGIGREGVGGASVGLGRIVGVPAG
jgi:hypothetical protein